MFKIKEKASNVTTYLKDSIKNAKMKAKEERRALKSEGTSKNKCSNMPKVKYGLFLITLIQTTEAYKIQPDIFQQTINKPGY